ncbi:MAG: sensor histidine kinase [Alphaproteobacteria bacterium]
MRLTHRYSLIIVTLLLSTLAVISGAAVLAFASLSQRAETASARVMADALREQAIADAYSLAALTSRIVGSALYDADMRDLVEDLRALRRYKSVLAIRVVDPQGRVLHDGSDGLSDYGRSSRDLVIGRALKARAPISAVEEDILSMAAPVIIGERLLGAIHMEISLADLMKHEAVLHRELGTIAAAARESLIVAIALAALILGAVGLLVGVLVARGLSQPIKTLSAAMRRIGQGQPVSGLPTDRSDEIGDLARDLEKMASGLLQSQRMSRLAAVGEVAVGVAHELNQPLSTIRMAADNALATLDAPTPDAGYLRDKLGLVSQLAGGMGEQIQRMCAVGRRDERRVPFDPLASVRDALALHSGGLAAAGIELTVEWPDAPDGRPLVVQGLPNQLMQVVVNLIGNARDAIVERSDTPLGRLRGVRGHIRLTMSVDPILREFRLEIADNGGGIPPEIIGRVFDPFFTTKEVTKGTGLGLSISYGIVAGMGGHIEARNGPDGAIFSVSLPTGDSAARAAE